MLHEYGLLCCHTSVKQPATVMDYIMPYQFSTGGLPGTTCSLVNIKASEKPMLPASSLSA